MKQNKKAISDPIGFASDDRLDSDWLREPDLVFYSPRNPSYLLRRLYWISSLQMQNDPWRQMRKSFKRTLRYLNKKLEK
ncbi:hypothetical protein TNCT_422511 [Trichonephila clavata]|uniref:Uncharacterized protein n=2 Tax=Trichonephila TaxID=2585208 RepID=A0A8X6G9V2_TRICU|nr:hypothetical protein TNCT_422511 [Trichonephila clavata]GFY64047.1 hypothetical protein TNIN_144741 [Trichonephila inaurata madagascariensis]